MRSYVRSGRNHGAWRDAAASVGRYPAATVIPGALLGAIAEAPHYFAGEWILIVTVLTYATAALAYAEEIAGDPPREPRTSHLLVDVGGSAFEEHFGPEPYSGMQKDGPPATRAVSTQL